MIPKVDLHTHSKVSDGSLTPVELVQRAADHGVELLALTDHDTCGGLEPAREQAARLALPFINGIELSTVWKGIGIHIVGLDFDPKHPSMRAAVDYQTEARQTRAQQIGEKLSKRRMPGVYEKALEIAEGGSDWPTPFF